MKDLARAQSLGFAALFMLGLAYVVIGTRWWIFHVDSVPHEGNLFLTYLGPLWGLIVIMPVTLVLAFLRVPLAKTLAVLIAYAVVATATWMTILAGTSAYHHRESFYEDLLLAGITTLLFTLIQMAIYWCLGKLVPPRLWTRS